MQPAPNDPVIDVDKPAKDDDQFWSVTTIIGALDKPALMYWAAEMAADAAIDSEATWKALLADRGRDEARTWLRDAMNRRPKTALTAADLGTTVHKVCEHYAITQALPDVDFILGTIRQYSSATTDVEAELKVVQATLEQFDRWLQEFTPTIEQTELAVYNDTYGYAGQLDSIMVIDGVRLLTDYKTSRESYDRRGQLRKPYPEQVGLQLAAYRYAELMAIWRARRYNDQYHRRYYLLNDDERALAQPVPQVDTGLVIHLTPQHCHAYPMPCGPNVFQFFLNTLEVFRWLKQVAIPGYKLERLTTGEGS